MSIKQLVDWLDATLQPGAYPDGQHNGLHIEGTRDVRHVASAVSFNKATLEAAIDADADVLLTHHGALWGGAMAITGVLRQRIQATLESGIHVVSYHLPLDGHPEYGNNRALADLAGCASPEPAFPYKGGPPIGCIGEVPGTPFSTWVEGLEAALRADCRVATGPFCVWPFGPETVRRIGFVSGAAAGEVAAAHAAGVDVFVTGEPAEAAFHFCKEAGIHFVAAGHYFTERLGVQRVAGAACEALGLRHSFVEVETLV